MKDVLTAEERAVVESMRTGGPWMTGHALAIIDRLAPKPREFSWAPGHSDFELACFSLGYRFDPCTLASVVECKGATSMRFHVVLAGNLGLLDCKGGEVVITEKGRAWLADYTSWSGSRK